jgi:hypothetical protein
MKKSPAHALLTSLEPTAALRWSLAAATGLLLSGCPEEKPKTDDGDGKAATAQAAQADGEKAKGDKECCMGKNDCKGKGGCAVPESHDCAGKNDCKGKGGCNMHCPK